MGRVFVRLLLIAGAGAVLAGCHFFQGIFGGRREPPPVARSAGDWRDAATEADRDRVRNLRGAWAKALAQVRAAGHGPELAALGPLADPDVALADPAPPPGRYRCRTIKLGAKAPGMLDYAAYPQFDCAVTADGGGRLALTKLTGSQRQKGVMWPDGDRRLVFLGTIELGDEQGPIDYGVDGQRNVAGIVERIGLDRWRLALPWPQWESNLDLVELVPQGKTGL